MEGGHIQYLVLFNDNSVDFVEFFEIINKAPFLLRACLQLLFEQVAKKTQVVLHMYDLCACTIYAYAYVYYNISLSLMTTFTNNMAALAVLS